MWIKLCFVIMWMRGFLFFSLTHVVPVSLLLGLFDCHLSIRKEHMYVFHMFIALVGMAYLHKKNLSVTKFIDINKLLLSQIFCVSRFWCLFRGSKNLFFLNEDCSILIIYTKHKYIYIVMLIRWKWLWCFDYIFLLIKRN